MLPSRLQIVDEYGTQPVSIEPVEVFPELRSWTEYRSAIGISFSACSSLVNNQHKHTNAGMKYGISYP